jgi:hypothetical protein
MPLAGNSKDKSANIHRMPNRVGSPKPVKPPKRPHFAQPKQNKRDKIFKKLAYLPHTNY